MTKTQILTALAVLLLAGVLAGTTASAQQANQPGVTPNYGGGGRIALLDVNYIFQEHLRFKSMMNAMKANVQAAEATMKREADAIQALTEQLKEYRSGTPEYRQMEEQITQRRADMSVQLQLQRKQFLQEEAKAYHTVYQEIQQEIQYYATRNGISAVFRFSGEKADSGQPDEVLRDINKSVVWFTPGLDITADILRSLNSRAGNPAANTGTVPYPAGRTQGVPFKR